MATNRTLTIASMAAAGWVKINEVSNTDMTYRVLCGGRITVNRSSDGKVFSWDTNTDHIRIYVEMAGPSDLAFITYASAGSGWFILDGFRQITLGQTLTHAPSSIHGTDVESLAKADILSLPGVGEAKAW